MAIKSWSTTAASNNSAPPNGWPEGMNPSAVNDTARQQMADIKTWYIDAEWADHGDSGISRASASSFKITGDVTGKYHAGRRLKCYDGSSTFYGVIASSSYSAPDTTINVTLDSGALTASLTSVALAILSSTNPSIPNFTNLVASGTSTLSGTVVAKVALVSEGTTTMSGTAVAKVALVSEGTTTLSGTVVAKTFFNSEGETTLSGTVTFKTVVTGDGVADQSAMEAASAVNRIVSPGRQHFHPSAAKFWVRAVANSTTITASYNMTSVEDTATGAMTINVGNDFSSNAVQALFVSPYDTNSLNVVRVTYTQSIAAGVFVINCVNASAAAVDPTGWNVVGFGDL